MDIANFLGQNLKHIAPIASALKLRECERNAVVIGDNCKLRVNTIPEFHPMHGVG